MRFTVKSNEIYGPLLAVGASVSAAAVPVPPGFGPAPGFHPVGFGSVPGFRADADFGAPGFGFGPPVFFPGPGFGGGPSTSWDVKVPASGHPRELYWKLGSTGMWYDFIVTTDSDSGFSRRVAGHVATGRPSVSDPGMGRADRF